MTAAPVTGPGTPTPPIALADGPITARATARHVEVDDATLARLQSACSGVTTDAATLAETSRDWWPLAMTWALEGQVGGLAAVVCRPSTAEEVTAVAAICDEAHIPLTVTA